MPYCFYVCFTDVLQILCHYPVCFYGHQCGYLLYRLFFIAQNAPDLYGTLIVSGIFAHIALQVVLNICVVLNVIPTTGVTLPFVSYGGTSVLFLMGEMGIALSVSRKIRFQDEEVPRKNSVTKNNENILTNDG